MQFETGEVIESSEAHITSIEQGDAFIMTDRVIPGRISSRTDVKKQLWLRLPDGKEKAFEIFNRDVAFRTGHRVSFLWAGAEGSDDAWLLGIRNHSTGRSDVGASAEAPRQAKRWKLETGGGGAVLGLYIALPAAGAALAIAARGRQTVIQDVVTAGALGLVAAFIASMFVLSGIRSHRAHKLVGEAEAFAEQCLIDLDDPQFIPPQEPGAQTHIAASPTKPDNSNRPLLIAAALVLMPALAYFGWQRFGSMPASTSMDAPASSSERTASTKVNAHGEKGTAAVRKEEAKPTDWSAYRNAQLRRHQELMDRAPSAKEIQNLSGELRGAGPAVAALYTLMRKGSEPPLADVLQMFLSKGVFNPGQPIDRSSLNKVMRDLELPVERQRGVGAEQLARALDAGKAVFLVDGDSLVRLTAVLRDDSGKLSGFYQYDPSGRRTGESLLSEVEGTLNGAETLISVGKVKY